MVEVLMGADGARVLKFKADLPLEGRERVGTGLTRATLSDGWTRGIVLTVDKPDSQRAFLIEPSDGEETIDFAPFHVRGGLRIVERINNTRLARAAWEAFEA